MSKSIIFTGGGSPNSLPEGLFEKGDYVIAADSGLEVAYKFGLSVDLWIGDLDSTAVDPDSYHGELQRFGMDKDASDTELALQQVRHESYVLVGGGGFRLDHLLGLYALFSKYGPPMRWFTAYETLFLVKKIHVFNDGYAGKTVSFFPATMHSEATVTALQLVWPLKEYSLGMHTISLSNRMTGSVLEVTVGGDGGIFTSFPVAQTYSSVLPS